MPKTRRDRKEDILDQISRIDGARRGQLSSQYYTRITEDGKSVRQGPYYVWQRYVNGKKRSVRVKQDQIERVQAELEHGKNLQELVEQLWTVLEQSAEQDQDSKKNARRPRTRASAKPKRPSS